MRDPAEPQRPLRGDGFRRPLRVGVALDGPVVPAWISKTLSELLRARFIDVVVFVLDGTSASATSPKVWRRPLLFSLYEEIDRRVFTTTRAASAAVDIGDEITVHAPVMTGLANASTLATIHAKDLDVLVWLASVRPRSELFGRTRFGIWATNLDESQEFPSSAPFARQLVEGEPRVVTALQILGVSGRDRVIYRSVSAVDPHSLCRTQEPVYWKAAHFMVRRLGHLHDAGWEFIRTLATYHEPAPARREAMHRPSNREMIPFSASLAVEVTRSKLRKLLYRETWFIAYQRRERARASSAEAFRDSIVVFPPRGRYYADPFVIRHGDRHCVFFEDYLVDERRAVISYFELGSDGRPSQPRVVLDVGVHLSYPCTFAHDGQIFMIPETAANRTVELYRAEEFPDRWVLDATMLTDISGVDATIAAHGGKLWLFVNVKEDGARYSDELCVFFAESLHGPWIRHSLNPVVSDVRTARPAGRIFERDGMLVRPGQDSSTEYGRAVVLNRIDVLTEDDYSETPIASIDGSWKKGNIGTHTYNFDDRYEVIDGRRWQARPWPTLTRPGRDR
jgi:hypothetical protein